MGKFVQRWEYVPDLEPECKADAVTDVLGATVLAMREYYTDIFSGLDRVLNAVNEFNQREAKDVLPKV